MLAVEREIVVMKLIDHPNIMHLYDVWETSNYLYLVLEYVQGGELFDHLCKHGPLPISEALKYFHQIVGAVDYLHRFNVAHRDLKLENILLDQNLNVKIADFGMAAWQISTSGATGLMNTSCGSPHYAAPEIIRGEPYVGSSADIWSCGVILYAMLTAQLPFDEDKLPDLLDKVTTGNFVTPSFVDPLAQNLIRRMLVVNVKQRITMPEIFEHPFFKLHNPNIPIPKLPELSQIARPLKSKSSIDPDIFANLRVLWPGASDDDLIKSLLDDDKNWQKGIYHLLVNYRANQAAENEVIEGEIERRRTRKAKDIAKARNAAAAILKQCEAGKRVTLSCSDNLHPARAEPPTQQKVRDHYLVSAAGADVEMESSSSEDLIHLMLDVKIPRLALTETTKNAGKLDRNHAITAIPVAPLPEPMNQPGLSALSTQAQVGDDDCGELPLEKSMLKRRSRQLVFSLGHDTSRVTGSTLATSAATRPLSVKCKSSGATQTYTFGVMDTIDKEVVISYDDSGNCLVDLSDGLNLQRELPLNRRWGFDLERDELGHCAHGQALGPIGSKRPPKSQHSQARSSSHPPSGRSGTTSPKHTWLDTIFRAKPSYLTKHTLYSTWDIITTRNECRRLLMNMNIQVQTFRDLPSTDGGGGSSSAVVMMKCKLDEMEDETGILGVMKPTKFRVVMKNVRCFGHTATSVSTTMSSGDSGTGSDKEDRDLGQTAVVLVHESGSGESFREIVRRLKRAWTLEGNGDSVGVL